MHTIFRTTSLYKQCLPVLSLKLLVSNFKALGLVCISSIKTSRVVLRSANGKKRTKKSVSLKDPYAIAIVACVELPTTR